MTPQAKQALRLLLERTPIEDLEDWGFICATEEDVIEFIKCVYAAKPQVTRSRAPNVSTTNTLFGSSDKDNNFNGNVIAGVCYTLNCPHRSTQRYIISADSFRYTALLWDVANGRPFPMQEEYTPAPNWLDVLNQQSTEGEIE